MLKQIALFIALLLGFFLFYISLTHDSDQNLVGQMAPSFTTSNLSGEKIALADQIGNKVVFVNFWATWCAPCREEIPLLNEFHKQFDSNQFVLISIIENEAPSTAHLKKAIVNFKKKIPFDFPVYQDPNGLIADSYGTHQIPESYLLDKTGKIVVKQNGALTKWDKKEWVDKINELIAAKP
jgi:thiol-disulfide isomerase/thioredoxin